MKTRLLICLFAALGAVLYGYDTGVISGALLYLQQSITLSHEQASLLAGAVLGGGAFSTLLAGALANALGRKKLLTLSSAIFVIGILLTMLAHSFTTLLWGRIIQGIGTGGVLIISPLYLCETVPTKWRTTTLALFQLLVTGGILLANIVDLSFTASGDWRAMFGIAGIIGLIMFVGTFYLKPSPRWLAMKGRHKEAQTVLQAFSSKEQSEKEWTGILQNLQAHPNTTLTDIIQQRHYYLPCLLVFAIAILTQLTGINSLLQLGSVILQSAGLTSNVTALLGSNAIAAVNFLVTLGALFLVNRLERKTLVCLGISGIILSFLYCSIMYFTMPVSITKGIFILIGFVGFIISFAIGPGALVWSLLSELLPSPIRSAGMGIALFLNCLTSTILASIFLPLTDWLSYGGTFLLLAVFNLLYFLLAFFTLPKTKHRSLEEIETQFN